MKLSNIVDGSRYAGAWDHNRWRGYVKNDPSRWAKNPHQLMKGETYGFFDGHAEFVPSAPLACTADSTAHNAEHVTPMVNAYQTNWYDSRWGHNKTYWQDVKYGVPGSNTVVGDIISLP